MSEKWSGGSVRLEEPLGFLLHVHTSSKQAAPEHAYFNTRRSPECITFARFLKRSRTSCLFMYSTRQKTRTPRKKDIGKNMSCQLQRF
jgi:hypothetical protein